jgi:hypothetical protein
VSVFWSVFPNGFQIPEGFFMKFILPVATERSQRTIVLPAFCDSCVCSLSVSDKNLNFSAVRSPIELKLGGDLGLLYQISVHVLVSRFDYFLYCKQKNAVLENLRFLRRSKSD